MGEAAKAIEDVKRIQACILFISRPHIRPVVRQELKALGVDAIYSTETVETCIEELLKHENALLVVDWEQGREAVNAVLRAAQGTFSVDTRPIFLIASEVTQAIVSTGAEYNVSRIHTGEISRGAIQKHLHGIEKQEADPEGIRAGLARVADARARGDMTMAAVILADMGRRNPEVTRLGCEMVDNRIQQEEWDDALRLAEELVSRAPMDLRAQHLYSRCLMRKGRFQEATEILQRTKLINPFNVDRLIDLGNALIQVDRIKEAMKNFDSALELDATNAQAMRGKGQCKLLEGDVNQALELLRQVSGPREMASVFNNSAILAIRQGRFEEGINLYQSAIGSVRARDRILARLIFNLGIAYHKRNRMDEALECFEQACSIDKLFDKCRHNAKVLAGLLGRTAQLPIKGQEDKGFIEDFTDFEDGDNDEQKIL